MSIDIPVETFKTLHDALKSAPQMGTFLEFVISMGGKPEVRFTHGYIEFDDFADLSRWLALSDEGKRSEALAGR